MRRTPFRNRIDSREGAKSSRPIGPALRNFQVHRRTARIPLGCKVFYSGVDVQGEGIIQDISLEGCRIEGNVPVRSGTKLSLVLAIPSLHSPTVIDRTLVVWSNSSRFGLRHELLLPSERAQLVRFLDSSLPTELSLPRQGPTSLST
jgi:hypothetical protein